MYKKLINTENTSTAECGATFKEHCQYPKCDCDRIGQTIHEVGCECPFCNARITRPMTKDEALKLAEASLALVDRSCAMLDGDCDCPRIKGKSFPDCKLLKSKV